MDQYTVVQQQPTAEKQGNGYAVAALTLGILSLLFSLLTLTRIAVKQNE